MARDRKAREPDGEASPIDRRSYMKLAAASVTALGGLGLGATSAMGATEGGPPNPADWQLAFEDTFDASSLDTSKWSVGFGWGRDTTGSPERIVDQNVNLRNGQLHLTGTHDGSDYMAGGVNTKGKAYFGPGSYWEAKIKMPKREGFLPAFWSKPNDESWPPEIDFVELFQTGSSRDTTHSNHHIHYSTSTQPGDGGSHADSGASYDAGVDLSQDFHIYGCEWQEDRIAHYVDGVKVAERTDSTIMQSLRNGAPFYMMLNIHIDRIGTADPSETWGEALVADWVRVWQYAPGSGSTADETTTEEPTTQEPTTQEPTTQEPSGDATSEHYLWVRSFDGNPASYAFEASGGNIRIDPNERASGESDEWVAADGLTAGGTVQGDYLSGDGYWYYGEISDLDYSGPLEVFIDDQAVDRNSLVDSSKPGPKKPAEPTTEEPTTEEPTTEEPTTEEPTTEEPTTEEPSSLPNTITIDGSDHSGSAKYLISVSGELERTDLLNGDDVISGRTAKGNVYMGTDRYRFSGEITDIRLRGDAAVSINGDRIDLLLVERAPESEGSVRYLVETNGSLMKADVSSASLNPDDDVSGAKAFSRVVGGADAYWITSGDAIDVSTFGGDVVTSLNGTETDLSN